MSGYKSPLDISHKLENGHTIPCQLKIGDYGALYAVFRINVDAEQYETLFIDRLGCTIACFDGYDNAYRFPFSVDSPKE